jgi:hypothetical protein
VQVRQVRVVQDNLGPMLINDIFFTITGGNCNFLGEQCVLFMNCCISSLNTNVLLTL